MISLVVEHGPFAELVIFDVLDSPRDWCELLTLPLFLFFSFDQSETPASR